MFLSLSIFHNLSIYLSIYPSYTHRFFTFHVAQGFPPSHHRQTGCCHYFGL